jgi:hypothetical protein
VWAKAIHTPLTAWTVQPTRITTGLAEGLRP